MRKCKVFNGIKYQFDFCCSPEGERITWFIDSPIFEEHTTKLYYRHERTWNDHMGNTECGYYIIANLNGHKHRVYIY